MKYKVAISRDVIETKTIEIEAKSKEAAKLAALKSLSSDDFEAVKRGIVRVISVTQVE